MPPASEILEVTSNTAREMIALSIVWHSVILLVVFAMLRGWRPSARVGSSFLIAPSVSVFIASAVHSSWFNAASFLALALLLVAVTRALETPWRVRPTSWSVLLGGALVVYGFVYPHFVDGPWYRTFYAAPTGVVPCPTLALVGGFTLITGANGSRAIAAVLAVWTTFYALFGILKLGVVLDLGLVAAALGLAFLSVRR